MTIFNSIVLCAFVSVAQASYDPLGMYVPATDISDQAAIDNDQSKMEAVLGLNTPDGYADAKAIYENGGHSGSIVTVTLDSPLGSTVAANTKISGSTYTGDLFVGEAYGEASAGSTEIKIKYAPGVCQVGSLAEVDRNSDGCLFFIGTLNDGTNTYTYTLPTALAANSNVITLQSLATSVGDEMLFCANGCPEENAAYFMDYYADPDFGDKWVQAAFDRTPTSFANGNANFATEYDGFGVIECIKKALSYSVVMLYAMHKFEASATACVDGEKYGNAEALGMWDEGVAYYTGSQVGSDGTAADGKFSWALANKRCKNFATCGPDSGEVSGIAYVNYEQAKHFTAGKDALIQGDCDGVEAAVMDISELVYVGLIQGVLRYAKKVADDPTYEKGQGEGAAFAFGVLPRVYAESPAAAQIIYDQMGVSRNPVVDYEEVKEAFESVYDGMGIDCGLVGGYLNAEGGFYTSPNTAPCKSQCPDTKDAAVTLNGFGLDLTCKQLNNLSADWQESLCNDHGGAAVCPGVCGGKCACTDTKTNKFKKNSKGGKMSCLQLSRKKNYKSLCKKKAGAKATCPITCKGWCSWDDAFSLD